MWKEINIILFPNNANSADAKAAPLISDVMCQGCSIDENYK